MSDPDRQSVRIRRAPRLGVFVSLGVVLGIVAAFAVTSAFPVDDKVGFWGTAGYFSIWGIVLGGLLGAVVGLVLDAVLRRRAGRAVVARESVGVVEADDDVAGSEATDADAADPEEASER